MDKILIIAVIGAFFACSTNNTPTDGEMIPLLSPAMQMEPYNDGSGLIQVTLYSSGGNILEQGDYLNGYREGVYTEFHPNGFVKSIVGYVRGKKQGQYILIDEKGQVLLRSTFHEDLQNGEHFKYNRSRIKESSHFINGQVHGLVEKYYGTGKIMERSYYNSGKLDGISRWYDLNGKNTIAYEYKMGELVGDVELFVNTVPTN